MSSADNGGNTHVLDPYAPNNQLFLNHERWLEDKLGILILLNQTPTHDNHRVIACMTQIRAEKEAISDLKRKEWTRQQKVALAKNTLDPGIYMNSPLLHYPPAIALSYLTTVSLHFLSNLSLKDCDFLLENMNLQYNIAHPSTSKQGEELGKYVPGCPKTTRTILRKIHLFPKTTSFACCPKCCSLYPLGVPSIPRTCLYKALPLSNQGPGDELVCGTSLFHQDTERPVREFVMQDFEHWLAQLFARPGMEELLDSYVNSRVQDDISLRDIWDGEALRTFMGPDGKLFMDCPSGESRLIFSINTDGFNPFGNRQAGKKVSCSAIYLTCLNLPPHVRNRPENIFLFGVIPGPKEPSLTQINHFLRPLVEIFLRLWNTGIFFEHTPNYPCGRQVSTAVIPVVTDLPAGRQMVGLGSHSCTNFCSCCHIKIQDKNNTEYSTWIPRTWETHIMYATAWKNATTTTDQEKAFNVAGVRWSELLRLPYWNPTAFLTIDTMHCFYLGLFERHVNEIWGMSATEQDGRGRTYDAVCKPPSDGVWKAIVGDYQSGKITPTAHGKWTAPALTYLCFSLGLPFSGIKSHLIERLQEHHTKTFPPPRANATSHRAILTSTAHYPMPPSLSSNDWSTLPLPFLNQSFQTQSAFHTSSISAQPHFDLTTTQGNESVSAMLNLQARGSSVVNTPPLTPGEMDDIWVHEYKSKLEQKGVSVLLALLRYKHPTSYILTEVNSSKKTIVREIQRLRKNAGVISNDEKETPHITRPRKRTQLEPASISHTTVGMSSSHQVPTADEAISSRLFLTDSQSTTGFLQSQARGSSVANTPSLTPDELNDIWVHEYKSKLEQKGVSVLLALLRYKHPTSHILTEADPSKKSVVLEIQRLRKNAGVISNDEKETPHITRPRKRTQLEPASISTSNTAVGMTDNQSTTDFRPPPIPTLGKPKHSKKTRVLGQNTVHGIKQDMSRLTLLSWVPKGPSYPGEARQGKLHADQWRSFCSINLVVTLTRLWGVKPKDSEEGKMLKNFLHLVTAVKYASLRIVNQETIKKYQDHIQIYLQTLLEFYPGTSISPNQHMALHIGEHLQRFGPVHAWRCFPYERFNYILQNVSTNSINSQMEKTMFNSFCAMQQLRHLCHPSQLPSQIHPSIPNFRRTFENDVRGTLLSEDWRPEDKESETSEAAVISPDWYALLCNWYEMHDPQAHEIPGEIMLLQSISTNVTLKTSKVSYPDSLVTFRLKNHNLTDPWRAGTILSIFRHVFSGKVFLVVEPYKLAMVEKEYPWVFHDQEFRFLVGYLFHEHATCPPVVIALQDVMGHFAYAKTDYVDRLGNALFHAVPLEKE